MMQLHEHLAGGVLVCWALYSIIFGWRGRKLADQPFSRGKAMQFFVWGLINLGIGMYGFYNAMVRTSAMSLADYQFFSKILMINGWIDFAYIAIGWAMLKYGALKWQGHGAGIWQQGVFLLLFDWLNYGVAILII